MVKTAHKMMVYLVEWPNPNPPPPPGLTLIRSVLGSGLEGQFFVRCPNSDQGSHFMGLSGIGIRTLKRGRLRRLPFLSTAAVRGGDDEGRAGEGGFTRKPPRGFTRKSRCERHVAMRQFFLDSTQDERHIHTPQTTFADALTKADAPILAHVTLTHAYTH